MRNLIVAMIACALVGSGNVQAEIERTASSCKEKLCFIWWPKVTPEKGWMQDIEASHQSATNILVRQGQSFATANTIMYAKAAYKPRLENIQSLADYIRDDHVRFENHNSKIKITAHSDVHAENQTVFKVFEFVPAYGGNWERVAYAEEGDFFVVFVISSRTKFGHKRNLKFFESMLRQYQFETSDELGDAAK